MRLMTKKSQARLERDQIAKAAKDNHCWDELHITHASIANALTISNAELTNALSDTRLYKYLPHPKEVAASIRSHATDLNNFRSELNEIHDLHKNRSGGLKDPEDLAGALRVGELYYQFNSRYQSIVIPTITYLLEQFGEAGKAYDSLSSTDVTVVTDVVPKQITTAN